MRSTFFAVLSVILACSPKVPTEKTVCELGLAEANASYRYDGVCDAVRPAHMLVCHNHLSVGRVIPAGPWDWDARCGEGPDNTTFEEREIRRLSGHPDHVSPGTPSRKYPDLFPDRWY